MYFAWALDMPGRLVVAGLPRVPGSARARPTAPREGCKLAPRLVSGAAPTLFLHSSNLVAANWHVWRSLIAAGVGSLLARHLHCTCRLALGAPKTTASTTLSGALGLGLQAGTHRPNVHSCHELKLPAALHHHAVALPPGGAGSRHRGVRRGPGAGTELNPHPLTWCVTSVVATSCTDALEWGAPARHGRNVRLHSSCRAAPRPASSCLSADSPSMVVS